MPSDFWWKKKSFVSLRNNFWSFKKREKNIYQCKKNLSFSSEIWGHFAFTFCRYLNQNMRAFTFCRYCPPIVFCPQIWKTKRTQKSRAITLNFWDEVFSLGMPSVCPHLTTVHAMWGTGVFFFGCEQLKIYLKIGKIEIQ